MFKCLSTYKHSLIIFLGRCRKPSVSNLALYVPGRDSSVGIGTRYGLDGPGIESRWGGGAGFSAPVQTGPGAHPAPYAVDTGSFPGVKRLGRGVDHPSPSNAEVVACTKFQALFRYTG